MDSLEVLLNRYYLAHVADAVVVIDGAVFTAETQGALTAVMIAAVDASSAVFTRVEFFGTELNLLVAIGSCHEVIIHR